MMRLIERALRCVPRAALGTDGPFRFLFRSGGCGPTDTTQAIVWGSDARPVALVKIARGDAGRRALRNERDRLDRLSALMNFPSRQAVPRPLGFVDDGLHAVLTETHLPGRRIKDLDPGVLTGQPEIVTRVVDWLIDFTLAAGVRRVEGDSAWLRRNLDDTIARYVETFETDPVEERLLGELSDRVRDALGPAVPVVAAHGDFCDANILVERGHVGVVDWGEPLGEALPGADLFHFFCSLMATKHGLGRRDSFVRAFTEGFFSRTPSAELFSREWTRYRHRLDLPEEAGLPLFAAAWVVFAVEKLRYLSESIEPDALRARLFAPQQEHLPLAFFADGRCLNVSLTAKYVQAFAL